MAHQLLRLAYYPPQLVVPKLRSACDYYRLPKEGRKPDLVARLEARLAKSNVKKSEPLSP